MIIRCSKSYASLICFYIIIYIIMTTKKLKEKVLSVLKTEEFNDLEYKGIETYTLCSIISEIPEFDFYFEELRSDAGEWEWYCYLDYYDDNLHHVVMVDEVYYDNDFEWPEDLADWLVYQHEKVEACRNKLAQLPAAIKALQYINDTANIYLRSVKESPEYFIDWFNQDMIDAFTSIITTTNRILDSNNK